ncbi:hotdog fold thioesterase [Mycobacterium sp. SVM_VP21]|nr:hotdog fold thioesterase [Mycobacterium sp. SVM_VP21]
MDLATAQRVLDAQPFNRVVGARLEAFADGNAILAIDIADQHRQQFGFVHGGVMAYAADNALTFAAGSVLGPNVLTGGMTVNYLRPARDGVLRAHAAVARGSARQAVCTVEIFVTASEDTAPTLCAIAQGWVVQTDSPKKADSAPADGVRGTVAALYSAFAAADGAALADLLHPQFVGRVSSGMPLGAGGPVEGPEQMLLGVWGATFAEYDTAPQPDEVVVVGPDRAIVFGYYRGRSRSTDQNFEAAFTHDITVRDGKVASLIQITDTKPWHDALV